MSNSLLPSLFGKNASPYFESLQKEIDRVFEDFRELNPWDDSGIPSKSSGKLAPRLDVSESEKEVEVSMELPGVKMDDIDISVTDNVLTVKGEKQAEQKKEENDYHLVERSYGSFYRSIPLGFSIGSDDVTADFTDGVLTMKITKPAEVAAKTQKVKISTAA